MAAGEATRFRRRVPFPVAAGGGIALEKAQIPKDRDRELPGERYPHRAERPHGRNLTVRALGRRLYRGIGSASGTGGGAAPEPGPSPALATFTPDEVNVLHEVRPYTMTSPERLVATMDAVAYAVGRGIPGALVECGVWRGGSVLAMIRTLQRLGVDDREVYLFDTFDGMTKPTEEDTSPFDPPALETWEQSAEAGRTAWDWAFSPETFSLDEVRKVLHGTGYPPERIHFEVGPVEDTLPERAPASVAVLRLDTDWYASTAHELTHLYPRLSEGGVLIIDDYGHWEGARRAVDEYFSDTASPILLSRVDYTGRMGVKR
jgi:O-methyltransferase